MNVVIGAAKRVPHSGLILQGRYWSSDDKASVTWCCKCCLCFHCLWYHTLGVTNHCQEEIGKELHHLRINNAVDEPFTLELLRWLDVEADSCLEKFI